MNLQIFALPSRSLKKLRYPTDSELVMRIRSGETKAFEIVMRRHNQRLYRIARSILRDEHESMDVLQEAYVKAYYKLDQFNGPNSFASWLSRIVSNEALMRIRKNGRIHYTLDDPMHSHQDIESSDPGPVDEVSAQQLRKLLEHAIDTLPVDYRSVYVMRAIHHLSTIETAKSLDVTEQVVKTRYLRAKRALRKIFEKHMEKADLKVHDFAGRRCNFIVRKVMGRL
ncbi:MAG: RNA polymerase sigma factor [Methylococcales bacterium]